MQPKEDISVDQTPMEKSSAETYTVQVMVFS